jgi:hypothetical protein
MIPSSGTDNQTEFSLHDIRTQRHLVLSTIKAAILHGGDISVQLFMRVSRHLPVALCSVQHQHLWSHDRTTGFIRIKREYRFTHVDTSADTVSEEPSATASDPSAHKNEKHPVQCFSPLVLDSLVRGIFFSLPELEMLKSACSRHAAALQARTDVLAAASSKSKPKKKKKGEDDILPEDGLIRDVIYKYAKTALNYFDQGDFVLSAGWMMLLQSFVSSSYSEVTQDGIEIDSNGDSLAVPLSYCMTQLSSITAHVTGKLQSAVNSAEAVIDCVAQVVQSIASLTSGKYKVSDDLLPDHATDIYFIYDAIGAFLSELREIVLCVYRDIATMHCSDAALVVDKVMNAMTSLFHSKHLNRPLLPKNETLRIARRGEPGGEDTAGVLQDMTRALKALEDPLREVSTGLKLLCASIAGDLVLELIQMDSDCRHRYKTPYSGRAIVWLAQGMKDAPNPSWLPLHVCPKTFSELIGE